MKSPSRTDSGSTTCDGQRAPSDAQREQSAGSPDVGIEFSKRAIAGGVVAFAILFAGTFLIGEMSGAEARILLESTLATARFLYSAVITAAAAILALMLTLISLSYNTEGRLKPSHYRRVLQIAFVDSVAFVAATTFLLFLVVPIQETENVAASWYKIYYYVTIGGSALLGGLLITIVLMLYASVRDLIIIVGMPEEDHPLVRDSDE